MLKFLKALFKSGTLHYTAILGNGERIKGSVDFNGALGEALALSEGFSRCAAAARSRGTWVEGIDFEDRAAIQALRAQQGAQSAA